MSKTIKKRLAFNLFFALFIGMSNMLAHADVNYLELLAKAEKVRTTDPTLFFEILEQLNAPGVTLSDNNSHFLKYLNAYSNALKGKHEAAINLYTDVVSNTADKELKFRSQVALANLLAVITRYTEGLGHLEEALSYVEEVASDEVKNLGLIGAAVVYNKVAQYDLAEKYSQRAIKDSNQRGICFAKNVYLESRFKQKNIQADDPLVSVALEQCEQSGEIISANLIRMYIARQLLERNQTGAVITLLEQNFEDVHKTKYTNLISVFHALLAQAQYFDGQAEKARAHALNSVDISAKDSSASWWVKESYKVLYEIHRDSKNMSEALTYHERYLNAEKAYVNDLTAKQLAYQLAAHQTIEKNREIELLNKQNQVLQLEQDLAQKEAANNKLVVALLILGLAFLTFWAYRVKRNQVKLRKQSETDQLTGIFTRHHFYALGHRQIDYCRDSGQDVSFILFDMDNFKSVNDNHGHLVGDWVLKKAIEVCRPCWRNNDIVGRLGGEEFSILLPGCDINKAKEIAEHCRRNLEAVNTEEAGCDISMTASFGITSSQESGYNFKQLITDSDFTMYQAKHKGKNRVELFVPEAES